MCVLPPKNQGNLSCGKLAKPCLVRVVFTSSLIGGREDVILCFSWGNGVPSLRLSGSTPKARLKDLRVWGHGHWAWGVGIGVWVFVLVFGCVILGLGFVFVFFVFCARKRQGMSVGAGQKCKLLSGTQSDTLSGIRMSPSSAGPPRLFNTEHASLRASAQDKRAAHLTRQAHRRTGGSGLASISTKKRKNRCFWCFLGFWDEERGEEAGNT